MVFACSERKDRPAKAASPANLSPAAGLELPRFKWGTVRLMRCQLPHSNYSFFPETDNKNDEVEDEAADADLEVPRAEMVPQQHQDASFCPPPPLPHEEVREKRKRKKEKMSEFRITLTKDEIDEDFFGVTAARAPRRPRRRPKAVQSQIECLFPGSFLPKTIAPDRYRVPD